MFRRITLTAVSAGMIAGVFLWAAHLGMTTPLIQAAEVFESATPAAAEGVERAAFTLLADLVYAAGFAFLLTAAVSLKGGGVDWRVGILWGLSGYAVFFLAPSLGLPPELPGMKAAALESRQIWWLATVIATAIGLGLAAFPPSAVAKALGLGLIVAPHLIGAPAHEIGPSDVPAALAAQFAITTAVVSGLFWIVLGGCTGYFYNRFGNA